MEYNWQFPQWPEFRFHTDSLQSSLMLFSHEKGRTDGLWSALSEELKSEALIDLMVSEAIKTSAIEGEMLSRPDVMSSIKNNLGLQVPAKQVGDRRVEGIAELMVCVRNNFNKRLSQKMLFEWHAMLMKGTVRIKTGAWRTHADPMLIVSGTMGNEQVHYEAPPSSRVPAEMKCFIDWFNATAPGKETEIAAAPIRTALAHLYFESIHPFEDGNGRIGRSLAEKALSQGLSRPLLLGLSQSIEANRKGYYEALKTAQRSVDVTEWIHWFLEMLINAQQRTEDEIEFTLNKTRFFDRIQDLVNARQLKVLKRMLKEGPEGFEGGMTSKKYMAITKTTKATATRDLQDLVKKEICRTTGGGRSVSYQMNVSV